MSLVGWLCSSSRLRFALNLLKSFEMAEPTLGELVKMQEELGGTKRLRRQMTKSDDTQDGSGRKQTEVPNQSRYPLLQNSQAASSDSAPREEPATLKGWKSKYGSRYMNAMNYKPGDERPRVFKPRDPRFDTRCGDYLPEVFRANYSFVKDMRNNEVKAMKEEIRTIGRRFKEVKDKGEKLPDDEAKDLLAKQKKLKQLVKVTENRLVNEQRKAEQYKLINEVKRKEALDSAREGRHPHFMNKAELKKLKLAAQYRQLKESGELDKYLDRKRKKAAQGSRRFRPNE